ncbi:MAG TPA: hypothetical protein VNJ51_00235 [Candidatus Dormibacteraeota bacterium]|nr:hypothetical protein [Candidatus Dormibacteraeota bacterium]
MILLAPSTATVSAAAPAPAAAVPDPLQIFARHEAAVGYSLSDGKAKPFVERFTESWTGGHGAKRTATGVVDVAGAYYRLAVTQHGSRYEKGFDGGFWRTLGNGNVVDILGFDRPFQVTEGVIRAEAYGPALRPRLVKTTATEDVVRIHPPSGSPADIFFNAKTALIDETVIEPGGDDDVTTYAGYRRIDGVMVPTTETEGTVTTTVTSFAWNAPLTDADLRRPSQPGSSTRIPASSRRGSRRASPASAARRVRRWAISPRSILGR